MNKLFIVIFAFSLMIGCSNGSYTYDVTRPSEYPILRATGYAVISRQPGPTSDDRTLQAMRASKLDAYRELSEQVYGQQLIADTSLRDNIQNNDELKARTAGVIKGARVIRAYPINNTYVTELELDSKLLFDLYEMRGAL
jgi:outer membrane protein FlgP